MTNEFNNIYDRVYSTKREAKAKLFQFRNEGYKGKLVRGANGWLVVINR
jgi:hypothetical protein